MKARFALAVLGLAAVEPATAAAPSTSSVHRVFDITREGSKIGTNTIDIARQGDMTTVKMVTHVLVKVMFVTAYRYDHTESASYKGSQLVSFTSKTDDNGTDHTISAKLDGQKILLTVDGEQSEAPKAIVPAHLWSADVSIKSQLFDPGTGKRLSTKPQDLGEETVDIRDTPQQLHHVKLTGGQFDRDLWFDKDGMVKMTMLGSDKSKITSEMRSATAEH